MKDQNSNNLISILICSKNRRHELTNLVTDLKLIKTNHSFEIIVVEETDVPLAMDDIKYISHPVANRGISFARNLALSHAKGNILIFLDDDSYLFFL